MLFANFIFFCAAPRLFRWLSRKFWIPLFCLSLFFWCFIFIIWIWFPQSIITGWAMTQANTVHRGRDGRNNCICCCIIVTIGKYFSPHLHVDNESVLGSCQVTWLQFQTPFIFDNLFEGRAWTVVLLLYLSISAPCGQYKSFKETCMIGEMYNTWMLAINCLVALQKRFGRTYVGTSLWSLIPSFLIWINTLFFLWSLLGNLQKTCWACFLSFLFYCFIKQCLPNFW